MKKLAIAAILATFGLSVIAPAQNETSTSTSGPWMMRASTGDKTADRLWFIMDRTLNAAEKDTIRTMFRDMKFGVIPIESAIVNAIDSSAKTNPTYSTWSSSDWSTSNGMSEMQVRDALYNGLNWKERGIIEQWADQATMSQLMAVEKLVQRGGWANSMWTGS